MIDEFLNREVDEMEDLEIDLFDETAIHGLAKKRLKDEGYTGPVLVWPERLYEIHKDTSKQIAKGWITLFQMRART